jgi:hypothetical protein
MNSHAKQCCTAFFGYSEGDWSEIAPPFEQGGFHPVDGAQLACYVIKIV